MAEDEIRATQQRTRRYWVEDGLPELAIGLLLLYASGLMLMPAPQRRAPVGVALNIGWIVLGLSSFWLLKRMKARTTFPRTGYAVPGWLPRTGGDWVGIGLIAVPIALALWLGPRATGTAWEPLLLPLEMAVILAGVSMWLGVPRLALVGVSGLVGAFGFFYAGMRGDRLTAAFCAVIGGAALLSGILTFASYRRRTQAPPEAEA